MLTPDDAETLVEALDLLDRVLAERRDMRGNATPAQPSAKLRHLTEQLRRAKRKCAAVAANPAGNSTSGGSSPADHPGSVHDRAHATVGSAEAARILGVQPNAVRMLARRDPTRLGSERVEGRWRHDLALVERRATRKYRS